MANQKLKNLLTTPQNNSFYSKNRKISTPLEFTYQPIKKLKKQERSSFYHSLEPASFHRTFSIEKNSKPLEPTIVPNRKSTSQYVSCSSAKKINFSY